MTQVSKALGATVTQEIKEAITAILAKHNLDAPDLSWGYGDYYKITVKASAIVTGLNGINKATPEAQYYESFGWEHFPPFSPDTPTSEYKHHTLTAPLGTRFTVKGKEYLFAGIDPKKRKFPIMVVEAQDGTTRSYFNDTPTLIEILNKAGETA